MNQSASRWSVWHAILFLFGVVVWAAASVFLAFTLLRYYPDTEQLWASITNVYALFGVLLGVGVAFALVAMAISYLSLNAKLQQAQTYLAQAHLHLDEYKQLSRQEGLVHEKVERLVTLYESLQSNRLYMSEVEPIKALVKQVLTSEFADFEARLVARTIQQDIHAREAIAQAEQGHGEESLWQYASQQAQMASQLWQTMLSAAPNGLFVNVQKSWFSAQMNQAMAMQHLAEATHMAQQPEHYREQYALYQPVMVQAGKTKDAELKQMIHQAAYQAAMLAYQEGEVLWQQEESLEEAQHKWQRAKKYFAIALEAQPDDVDSVFQWGNLLEHEARLVAQNDAERLPEARQLWLLAREKYRITLDIDGKRADAAFNWGNTLADEATALVQTNPELLAESRILWQMSREKFDQTLDIDPHFDAAEHNMGMTFNKEADMALRVNQNIDEARNLWKYAGEHFQAALNINKNRYETANSWGLILAKEADLLVQVDLAEHELEAKRLWQLAEQRFHRALEIEANLRAAASNWRTILTHEANIIHHTEERQALWQAAYDKVMSLRQVSPKHTESVIVAELADWINEELVKLQPVPAMAEPPHPVVEMRWTNNH